MSQKNHEGKKSARERLQEERARERARARRGRQAIVAGAVVVVLAVAGGIAVWASSSSEKPAANDNEVAVPKKASDGARPAVPVGAAGAPSTLTVWEDFRCPACRQFETGFRPVIHELEDSGRLKSEYHLVTIIDGNAGGQGSRNAANAALCAQDAGKFRAYHDVLYTHQPPEPQDKFADKQYLLQLAGKVKGLVTPAFTKCVNDGRYNRFVEKSNDSFAGSGYRGTPTVLLNGKDLSKEKGGQFSPADLKKMVLDAGKAKQPGKKSAPPQGQQSAAPHTGASPQGRHPGRSAAPPADLNGGSAAPRAGLNGGSAAPRAGLNGGSAAPRAGLNGGSAVPHP